MHALPSSLNTLRTFEVAARRLSFKDAADELCLSASAVSRQISGLEEDIGVALFERGNRSLQLTQEGQQLFEAASQALGVLSATVATISPQGQLQLRLSAQPYFANNWLLPRLHAFTKQHRNIRLTFESALTYKPFDSAKVDGCFRFDAKPDTHTQVMKLHRQYMIPLASPRLLEREGWNGDLNILNQLSWFHSTHQPDLWERWQQHFNLESLSPAESLYFDDAETALQAAREGLGVVMGAIPIVQRDLDEGKLIPLTQPQQVLSADYYFVYPKTHNNPAINAMVQWLDEHQWDA
jgi:LysR family glycine cleavage system transcriptional activator